MITEELELGLCLAAVDTIEEVAVRLVPRGPLKYESPPMHGPERLAALLRKIFEDEPREVFVVIHTSMANTLISFERISRGGLSSSIVEARTVFQGAILANAASIFLGHNHPSGSIEPSAEDISVTNILVEAGKLLGIPVRDHLIIGGDSFTSMARRGLM
jgi:DNA repair protein RadC